MLKVLELIGGALKTKQNKFVLFSEVQSGSPYSQGVLELRILFLSLPSPGILAGLWWC